MRASAPSGPTLGGGQQGPAPHGLRAGLEGPPLGHPSLALAGETHTAASCGLGEAGPSALSPETVTPVPKERGEGALAAAPACTRLGLPGAECGTDGSRGPGSGQLHAAAAAPGVGYGGVRGGAWTPPSLAGGPQGRPGPRLGALAPTASSEKGTGSGRGPGLVAGAGRPGRAQAACALGLSGQPRCGPAGPCPEPGVTGRAPGRLPVAPRQGLPPVLPAPGALGVVGVSGRAADGAVGAGGGGQVGKAAERFGTRSSEEHVPRRLPTCRGGSSGVRRRFPFPVRSTAHPPQSPFSRGGGSLRRVVSPSGGVPHPERRGSK